MKIDRVKLTLQLGNEFDKKWVGLEAEIDETEDAKQSITQLKEIITSWASIGQVIPDNVTPYGPPPVIQVKPEDREIGITVDSIMSCNDITVLESYRWLIKGKWDLEEAYFIKRDKLNGK